MIDDHYQPSPMSHNNPNHVCRGIYQWLGATSHMTTTTTTTQQTLNPDYPARRRAYHHHHHGGSYGERERGSLMDGGRRDGFCLLPGHCHNPFPYSTSSSPLATTSIKRYKDSRTQSSNNNNKRNPESFSYTLSDNRDTRSKDNRS